MLNTKKVTDLNDINANVDTNELTKKANLINLKQKISYLNMVLNGSDSKLAVTIKGVNGYTDVTIPLNCNSNMDTVLSFDNKTFIDRINLFKSFEQENITISRDYNFNFSSNELETEIPGTDLNGYFIPDYTFNQQFEITGISKSQFKKDIESLKKFVASPSDYQTPCITGIRAEIENDKIRLIALDGFRLHVKEYDGNLIKVLNNEEEENSFNINNSTLNALIKILGNCKKLESITIKQGVKYFDISSDEYPYQIIVKADGETITLTGVTIDNKYFDYNGIIPKETNTSFNVDSAKLKKTLNVFKPLFNSDSENKLIRLWIKDNLVNLDIPNARTNKDLTECENIKGEELLTGFNGQYLIDSLNNLKGNVKFEFKDKIAPVQIYPTNNKDKFNDYYLVLPIRIG